MGTEYSMKIEIEAVQAIKLYKEEILNGTDPVLSNNLVPVTIEDDGTVKKASLYKEWYRYSNQRWANAVVLEDKTVKYKSGDIISETNIESYFVWIPKYSYKLWDLGEYTSLTTIDNAKVHTIPIKFGLDNTSDSNDGECTTPGISGASGNCKIGDYMTHPAFLAFDSNGFWVGKFESGYRGATSTAGAQQNISDYSKLIIKPNVYSWRSITIGNMFYVSYNYLREDESHMMKNTEWGCVAYLHHSDYGSHESIRNNNNQSCVTGWAAITAPTCGYQNGASTSCNTWAANGNAARLYNTPIGYLASTTRNITGIYDMVGGSVEYTMGYNTDAQTTGGGITNLYHDFFTNPKWDKYYNKYKKDTSSTYTFTPRILGDATSEMGPFEYKSNALRGSWYNDGGNNYNSTFAWFCNGGYYGDGFDSGIFSSSLSGVNGEGHPAYTFRLVLTP